MFSARVNASVVPERRAGRACFAEVKEESYSPLAACRTRDMEQSRPSRPGAIAQNPQTASSPNPTDRQTPSCSVSGPVSPRSAVNQRSTGKVPGSTGVGATGRPLQAICWASRISKSPAQS